MVCRKFLEGVDHYKFTNKLSLMNQPTTINPKDSSKSHPIVVNNNNNQMVPLGESRKWPAATFYYSRILLDIAAPLVYAS